MKNFLEIPILDVLSAIMQIVPRNGMTTQKALEYMMFMGAISKELEQIEFDASKIKIETVLTLAVEYGGYIKATCDNPEEESMCTAVLADYAQNTLYIRLTYATAKLIKKG